MKYKCYECKHLIGTPVLPPCMDWEYCSENDYCFYEPDFICRIKAWIKKIMKK